MNISRMITNKIEWEAIKEAIVIIERVPNLQVHLEQLGVITKYAEELKRTVRYEIGQSSKIGCCEESIQP